MSETQEEIHARQARAFYKKLDPAGTSGIQIEESGDVALDGDVDKPLWGFCLEEVKRGKFTIDY